MIQSALNLPALASDEKVYAIVLYLQDLKECLAEGFLGAACTLARYRYGFVRAGRCLVLDKIFEVIIVNVDCARNAVS